MAQAATPGSKLLASIDEARNELGISRSSLYKLLDSGALRAVKVGSRRLIVRESMIEFIARASA